MSAIVTSFSVEPEVSKRITELSEKHGGNRSRWLADFLNEFGDDWNALQQQARILREVAPHVRKVRTHCKAIYTGGEPIRNWDREVMGLLRAGHAIGKTKTPEDVYIFHQMIDRLISELEAAKAENWSEPEAFDL